MRIIGVEIRPSGGYVLRAALLSGLLLSGCDGLPFGLGSRGEIDRSGVRLMTDAQQYERTGDVALTLSNDSGADVGYNLCAIHFQPRVSGTWAADIELLRMCTEELHILRDGGKTTSADVIPNLQPGTYRIRTVVYIGGAPDTIATAAFAVVPTAQ